MHEQNNKGQQWHGFCTTSRRFNAMCNRKQNEERVNSKQILFTVRTLPLACTTPLQHQRFPCTNDPCLQPRTCQSSHHPPIRHPPVDNTHHHQVRLYSKHNNLPSLWQLLEGCPAIPVPELQPGVDHSLVNPNIQPLEPCICNCRVKGPTHFSAAFLYPPTTKARFSQHIWANCNDDKHITAIHRIQNRYNRQCMLPLQCLPWLVYQKDAWSSLSHEHCREQREPRLVFQCWYPHDPE